MNQSLKEHLDCKRGSVGELLAIALPMVISNACYVVMTFTDRLFLSKLGPGLMNAAMGGGITDAHQSLKGQRDAIERRCDLGDGPEIADGLLLVGLCPGSRETADGVVHLGGGHGAQAELGAHRVLQAVGKFAGSKLHIEQLAGHVQQVLSGQHSCAGCNGE